jgi:hypothetical protein
MGFLLFEGNLIAVHTNTNTELNIGTGGRTILLSEWLEEF